jgi:hypothetical protein
MGKTELLNNFVLNILPGKCTILSSSGNPFSRSFPFVAWIDIVTQYLVRFQVWTRTPHPELPPCCPLSPWTCFREWPVCCA